MVGSTGCRRARRAIYRPQMIACLSLSVFRLIFAYRGLRPLPRSSADGRCASAEPIPGWKRTDLSGREGMQLYGQGAGHVARRLRSDYLCHTARPSSWSCLSHRSTVGRAALMLEVEGVARNLGATQRCDCQRCPRGVDMIWWVSPGSTYEHSTALKIHAGVVIKTP